MFFQADFSMFFISLTVVEVCLMKLQKLITDAEFVVRLEPNNQEVRKQYTEAKELLEKVIIVIQPCMCFFPVMLY